MKNKIDLSIIIVNYNGEKILESCLKALFTHLFRYVFEVIVIDNASSDNSLKIINKFKKQITVVKNKTNLGFSAANNQGLKLAKGEYVLLLNNDALVEENTLNLLVDYLKVHHQVGAVGPMLLNPDLSPQFTGSILGMRQYKRLEPCIVNFISGAAFLCSKKLLLEIGGLDENFFFYNEDLDLCRMISKKGYKIAYLPQAKVIHHHGVSTATRKTASIIEGYRGGLYFCHKHYPRVIYNNYRVILGFYLLLCLIFLLPLSLVSKKFKNLYNAYRKIIKITISGDIFLKKT